MNLLKISIPNICLNEQRYALDILLGDFLGLIFEVEIYEGSNIEITMQDSVGKLTLNSSFFHKLHLHWLKQESMPVVPLKIWDINNSDLSRCLTRDNIPVLYGSPGSTKNKNNWHINLDIFGSAFFMLARYEEILNSYRDEHDRFPDVESIAYKSGFFERPIINEYLEILWFHMNELWPSLKRKKRGFRKLISCDVDHPVDLVANVLFKTTKRIIARLIRDKEPKLAVLDGLNYVAKKFNSDIFDSYRKNIDWIMKVNSEMGNKVAFNFIPIQTNSQYDDENIFNNYKIKKLLKNIHEEKHEIGIHPGYDTFKSDFLFKQSVNEFKKILISLNIPINYLGGRQHYLRYDVSKTPHLWDNNGLDYDSSIAYSSMTGFKSGVCYEYRMYDLVNRKPLKLKQRPLIVMDYPIIHDESLGYSEASLNRYLYFKEVCKKFNGDFTLLWHNSFFIHESDRKFYLEIIR